MKKILTPEHHRRELGIVTRDGDVYLYPFRKVSGSIKNRLFTPKWVEQAFDQGKIVVDATVETKVDPASGRHYPVVRGKVVDDALVSVYLSLEAEIAGGRVQGNIAWASGKEETKLWPSLKEVPAHVMALVTADNLRRLDAEVRHRRLGRVMRHRYNNGAPVVEVKGIYALAKVEYANFDRRTMMVEVIRTYSADAVWTRYKMDFAAEKTRFVKTVEEGPHCPITRRMEPIDAYFKVERSKPYLKLVQGEFRYDYESNDGRSTRYDTVRYVSLVERVDVRIVDTDGQVFDSWVESKTLSQVNL